MRERYSERGISGGNSEKGMEKELYSERGMSGWMAVFNNAIVLSTASYN